jgi:hypothetical protein
MPEGAAAPLNFKAVAQLEKKDIAIKSVHLTGSVALKILQHCCESDNTGADGQLLGLDVSSILEVTECFPWLVCLSHILSSVWAWWCAGKCPAPRAKVSPEVIEHDQFILNV